MSYLVFARKWRPQSFEDVLAQDHVTVTLRNAIKSGRIGHAYLFTGSRGVGKTTTARILAKALNCDNGPSPTPCQTCDACIRITMGNHLDVLEIDGASNRGIDEIRDLREKARYAAAEGRYKIYIIDEVHMLTKEAFNALLKILEEPPDMVIFIFATTEPRKVPATILSRCQRFDFRRIPAAVMSAYLSREAGSEGISIDSQALGLICRSSGGSMRDALSVMDQMVSYAGNDIKGEEIRGLLGLVESDLLANLAIAILSGRSGEALDCVERAFARGYSIEEMMDAFISFLRNLLMVTTGASLALQDVSDSEMELLGKAARNVPDIAVLNVLRIITGAGYQARNSSLPRVIFESAVLTASKLSMAFDVADLPSLSEKVSVRNRMDETGRETGPEATQSQKAEKTTDALHAGAGPLESEEPDREPEPATQDMKPGIQAQQESGRPERNTNRIDPEEREAEKDVTRKILDMFDAISHETTEGQG
ncbi:MAG TPA: DNA polymerase III subunit gamma/tau [Thermoplasmata archaeon]|nr:DNA polymerase III subunit gamma/tau [Thermoplasmata archaeon]